MSEAREDLDTHEVTSLLGSPLSVTVGEALADRIVTAIAIGEFQPGQRLPAQRELSEMLGLSRSTVRDALTRVEALGMLEIRRGRSGGAYVARQWSHDSAHAVRATLEPRWEQLEHAFDMRRLVEGLVASTAAQRRTKQDKSAIGAALLEYEQASDLAEAQAADLRLHHAVARAANNPRLLLLRDQLLTEVSIGFAVEPFTPSVYARALPQHQALAEAVMSGDVEGARTLGAQHFTLTEGEMRAILQRAMQD